MDKILSMINNRQKSVMGCRLEPILKKKIIGKFFYMLQ